MNTQVLRDIVAARPKTVAFLAFLVLLNLALYLFLTTWQRPELDKARGEWSARRQAAVTGQGPSSLSQYQKGVKDLQLFETRFIPKKEFPSFLSRLFQSAGARSLSLTGVRYTPGAVKEDPRLVAYVIGFTVSGKYPSVKGFIADVEGYREMVAINSLALDSAGLTAELVNLRMQLTVYLKREGA